MTLYERLQKRKRYKEQTLWEKVRVGWFERIAMKHVYYHMWNRSPVQVRCMRQGIQGWCTGMTLRDGMGRYICTLHAHTHPYSLTCCALSHTHHNPQLGTLERSPSEGRTTHRSLLALPRPPWASVLPGRDGGAPPTPPGSEVSSRGESEEEGSVGGLWGCHSNCSSNGSRAEPSPLVTSQAGPGCLIPFMLLLSHVLKWSDG